MTPRLIKKGWKLISCSSWMMLKHSIRHLVTKSGLFIDIGKSNSFISINDDGCSSLPPSNNLSVCAEHTPHPTLPTKISTICNRICVSKHPATNRRLIIIKPCSRSSSEEVKTLLSFFYWEAFMRTRSDSKSLLFFFISNLWNYCHIWFVMTVSQYWLTKPCQFHIWAFFFSLWWV